MGTLSLLEQAAEVRAKKREVTALADEIKAAGLEWVGYSLAAEEAEAMAKDGLRHAWASLARLEQLAQKELARAKATPTAARKEDGRGEAASG